VELIGSIRTSRNEISVGWVATIVETQPTIYQAIDFYFLVGQRLKGRTSVLHLRRQPIDVRLHTYL